jgi:hypothetical protein
MRERGCAAMEHLELLCVDLTPGSGRRACAENR